MQYTYSSYQGLMKKLSNCGYCPIRFCDVSDNIQNPAIIRHDVDLDMQKAAEMAEIEKNIGIKSTYFVLISSEFYNLFSSCNTNSAKRILSYGHEIGLHFDITAYEKNLPLNKLERALQKEISLLECGLGIKVKSVSWHIPRQDLLGRRLEMMERNGIWNAYDPLFYNGYKYVSDSMMRWREPVEEYIENKEYEKLQILTHPVWYRKEQDMKDEEILNQFREKRIYTGNKYLNTIKPGFLTEELDAVFENLSKNEII